jgi:hypothetical protein
MEQPYATEAATMLEALWSARLSEGEIARLLNLKRDVLWVGEAKSPRTTSALRSPDIATSGVFSMTEPSPTRAGR